MGTKLGTSRLTIGMTDKEMANPPGLSLHGNSWRITKRIPTELLPYYNGKKHLRLNTGKSDKRVAASVAWQWHAKQEAEFDHLRRTGRREKTALPRLTFSGLRDPCSRYAGGT